MQKSFWWWQCSERYIISLSPHLHTSFPPPSPSLISLTVSVDFKHHVYLLTYCSLSQPLTPPFPNPPPWSTYCPTCFCSPAPRTRRTEVWRWWLELSLSTSSCRSARRSSWSPCGAERRRFPWFEPSVCRRTLRGASSALICCTLATPFLVSRGPGTVGRFTEAGLHEWMPFVIFRKVAASLPGRFLVGVASRWV